MLSIKLHPQLTGFILREGPFSLWCSSTQSVAPMVPSHLCCSLTMDHMHLQSSRPVYINTARVSMLVWNGSCILFNILHAQVSNLEKINRWVQRGWQETPNTNSTWSDLRLVCCHFCVWSTSIYLASMYVPTRFDFLKTVVLQVPCIMADQDTKRLLGVVELGRYGGASVIRTLARKDRLFIVGIFGIKNRYLLFDTTWHLVARVPKFDVWW